MNRTSWAILAATILAVGAGLGIAVWHGRSSPADSQHSWPSLSDSDHESDNGRTESHPPISGMRNAVGDLLRQWDAEQTAAGNLDDFYDNRDRNHSPFDLRLFPQMSRAVYPEGHDGDNYGRMTFLLHHVTIGNSSTSHPVRAGGSHPRFYYYDPRGMDFLYQQYRANNLYVYPAHHDHLPGRNGIASHGGFYGDLYPTNSPYLIISQGSSGTDQPFLQAMAATLAAFRPEVKQKLKEHGLLMPTLQMILRTNNSIISRWRGALVGPRAVPLELQGRGHPTVFDGNWLVVKSMIEMAHQMEATNLPPMVQMHVVEEDTPVLGKDYFEAGHTEKLCDTPCVIGRIFRGSAITRRIVVSAEDSFDVNKKPLTFRWSVLREHPAQEQVVIKPLNGAGSVVEIKVNYTPRYTTGDPSNIETNRVDIGCFVSSGTHYSAPGFVTFYFLDNESRTYDAGRPIEIGYGTGEAGLNVTDWPRLFRSLAWALPGLQPKIWERYLRPEQRALLRPTSMQGLNTAPLNDYAVEQQEKLGGLSVRQYLDAHVWPRMLRDPEFYPTFREEIEKLADSADEPLKERFDALWRHYGGLAILRREGGRYVLQSARAGPEPLEQRWTPFERVIVQKFHADLLSLIFDGIVMPTFTEDMVDARLVTPGRFWRDVYRYDPAGHCIGWVRCTLEGTMEFTSNGLFVLKKDNRGRPIRACEVVYEPGGRRMRLTKRFAHCMYSGPEDWRGTWDIEEQMP